MTTPDPYEYVLAGRIESESRGHHLSTLSGGIAHAAVAWSEATPQWCPHIDDDSMPSFALLTSPGVRRCAPCHETAAGELDAAGPRCIGCGIELPTDWADPHRNVITVSLTVLCTGLAEACPLCKAMCQQ